jgi:hypothetical protein
VLSRNPACCLEYINRVSRLHAQEHRGIVLCAVCQHMLPSNVSDWVPVVVTPVQRLCAFCVQINSACIHVRITDSARVKPRSSAQPDLPATLPSCSGSPVSMLVRHMLHGSQQMPMKLLTYNWLAAAGSGSVL